MKINKLPILVIITTFALCWEWPWSSSSETNHDQGIELPKGDHSILYEQSNLIWKGQKAIGDSHTGNIKIKTGNIIIDKNGQVKGSLIIDMTTINNTETFANVTEILTKGGKWFADLGVENSGGTKCFSVTGNVQNPSNFEVPMGTPFSKLLELAGGLKEGRTLKAVIPGGSSTPLLSAETAMNMTMDYDSIANAGSMLGAGSVIIMDDTTCMVKTLTRLAHFYYDESCGQCTPCREGCGWMWRMLERMAEGEATYKEIDLLHYVTKQIEGHTICAFGEGSAWPVQGLLRHFKKEIEKRSHEEPLIKKKSNIPYLVDQHLLEKDSA